MKKRLPLPTQQITLLARPLIALGSVLRSKVREQVWLAVRSRHHVFRDVRIRVHEDEERYRWVCVADVRRVVPSIADDRALALAYPEQFRSMGKPAQTHLRDDAMVLHLSRQGNLTSFKFRTWLEREVVVPGHKKRGDLAVKNSTMYASKQS